MGEVAKTHESVIESNLSGVSLPLRGIHSPITVLTWFYLLDKFVKIQKRRRNDLSGVVETVDIQYKPWTHITFPRHLELLELLIYLQAG